jgi:hypothetical protein
MSEARPTRGHGIYVEGQTIGRPPQSGAAAKIGRGLPNRERIPETAAGSRDGLTKATGN